MGPLIPIGLGAAALWVFYRKRHGLPVLPHLGQVPHIAVLTPAGPALVPATTNVIPVQNLSPVQALSLAQAAAQTQVDPGIHAPRYIRPSSVNDLMGSAGQGALGDMRITIDHQAVGQALAERPMLPAYQHPQHLAFDVYGHQTAPRSLRVDEFGILRSSLSRPFGVR